MFGYYFELALRSLRRNLIITAVMVAAIGVGIGASMTMLTTLVAMSADPIPDKSAKLFIPQIDVTGEATKRGDPAGLPSDLTYRDAIAFMEARLGVHQAAMYPVALTVKPALRGRFQAAGRATYSDFFAMFDVPFRSGGAWGRTEDDLGANVVVLSARLADRLFARQDAVGQTVNLGKRDYRVTGVTRPWILTPRFYDLHSPASYSGAFSDTEDFYLPFSTAIGRQMDVNGFGCNAMALRDDWSGRLNSDCAWIQFWVELPTAAQVRNFRTFLRNYAVEQRHLGRLPWMPLVALRNVTDWLAFRHVVPDEVRVNSLIATGFLIVCLINAIGLMLAKFSSRAVELSVRCALGASRMDLFLQCVTETLLIGVLGGLLGLSLTASGLSALRGLRGITTQDSAAQHLVSLNGEMVLITLATAIITTICSGLYPAIRASRTHPGWQLKAQ